MAKKRIEDFEEKSAENVSPTRIRFCSKKIWIIVSTGIDPGYNCLPQSKIIMYSFIGVLLSCEKF
jgi:hypothetical protein